MFLVFEYARLVATCPPIKIRNTRVRRGDFFQRSRFEKNTTRPCMEDSPCFYLLLSNQQTDIKKEAEGNRLLFFLLTTSNSLY